MGANWNVEIRVEDLQSLSAVFQLSNGDSLSMPPFDHLDGMITALWNEANKRGK
jgi:hypothetical protein